jgi:hypothetical protein
MARNGSVSKPVEVEEEVTFGVIRRNKDFVRHNAPIRFSDYRERDGRYMQIKFDKSDKQNYEMYGDMTWSVTVSEEPVYFNLKDPIDNLKFRFAKQMRDKNLYPFQASSPILVIDEPEMEDAFAVDRFNLEVKAKNILSDKLSNPKDRREFAYYFGLHEGNDNRVMKNLIEKANDDPQGFIEAYDDEFKHIVILVRKAVDLGIVSRRGEIGIFYFNEHQLGVSFDDIVSELVKDEALLTLLNSEVAKR